MIKRTTALLLTLCMCATLLAGCGTEDSGASTGSPVTNTPPTTEASEPAEQEDSNILGILYDMTSSYDFESPEVLAAVCGPLGLDHTQFDSCITRGVAVDSVARAMEELTAAGCTVIIFTDKMTSGLASSFADKYPEAELLVSVYEPVVEPIITAEYDIYEILTDFSDDRAWVRYFYGNAHHFGLIDQNGYLVYSISREELGDWEDLATVTEIGNGVYCIYNRDLSWGECGILLIDRDGNVILDGRALSDDSPQYFYMGHSDSMVLVKEHVSNFSEEGDYICQIDLNGQVIKREPMPEDFDNDILYTYMGDGLFKYRATATIDGYYWRVYNANSNSLMRMMQSYSDIHVMSDVEDGYVYYCVAGYFYKIPKEAFDSAESWENYDIDSARVTTFKTNNLVIGEGYIIDDDGIYDYGAQTVATFPENWNVIWLDSFSEGYAAIGLKGAAAYKYYFTVVDVNGAMQFEPTEYDYNYRGFQSAWHGYVSVLIDDKATFFDPTGKQTSAEEYYLLQASDKIGESGIACAKVNSKTFARQDGVMIDSVYVVSNYSEVAGQNHAPQPPSNSSNNQTILQKEYQFPSSYSIEGKWKNIGTYTFGQVGSGAIVAFDDTKCNFYSPADTYAFYAKGAEYKLDCTSLLGETLTFTVKIVDENHIDIVNGSNILELQRVG